MIYDIKTLQAAYQKGFRPKYIFFWGHQPLPSGEIGKSCFSQWWAAPFELDGVQYPSAEHYMMAEKARLFGDEVTRSKIIEVSHPQKAKTLGRQVSGFQEDIWQQHRFEIVMRGNLAKFGQNDNLRTCLLNTKNRVLVEASPRDRIWGIGLTEDDARATNPLEWQGLNLLGFALMKVHSCLAD